MLYRPGDVARIHESFFGCLNSLAIIDNRTRVGRLSSASHRNYPMRSASPPSLFRKAFLFGIVPFLAGILAWLGIATARTNLLGWFLFLIGAVFSIGTLVAITVRRERFWKSTTPGIQTQEERGDRSFWLISTGLAAAIFLPPIEYLFRPNPLSNKVWLETAGICLVTLGSALFIWARLTLGTSYSGHLGVHSGQELVRSGPYRCIRHPAYAGYLWISLGFTLGYASLSGLLALLGLVLPALLYRIQVEEVLLTGHFGEAYCRYASQTKRLIPGVW